MYELNCTIVNSTSVGSITLQALTNGSDYPPVSDGNPPVVAPAILNGQTVLAIQAWGGGQWEVSHTGPVFIDENAAGSVTYNLPDNVGILVITWDLSSGVYKYQIFNSSAYVVTPNQGNTSKNLILTITNNPG